MYGLSELPGGLRVVTATMPHLASVSVGIWVNTGGRHETARENGAAHFIEHMCFKGTKQKPTPLSIMTTYDDKGAYFNAETHRQYTCYKVKCMDQFIEPCLKTLADILLHSVFKKKEMDLERHVVLEENIRSDDNPLSHIEDAIYKALYTDTPYSDPIDTLEYHKSPHSLDHKDVIQLYREYYRPDNMGISVISNLSFATIKHLLEQSTFMTRAKSIHSNENGWKTQIPTLCLNTPPKTNPDIQFKIIPKKGVQATHISISFRTCPHDHADLYPLLLLKNIIGGYMSSRLFMLLREKNGLTYSSTCHSTHHASSGHFEIYTLCDPSKTLKNKSKPGVLPLLLQLLNDLIEHGITQKELTSTKGYFQGQLTLHMEQGQTKSTYNGIEYILYDKTDIVPYEQIFKTYVEHLTKDMIHQVIRRYFHPENMLVCLVGEHAPNLETVQRYCRHFYGR
jgi:predicted Zn-dependent peptidase